uniref:Caspase recruitment domain-containing protein 19 n=1 Tax=Cairina moschata TaxID=8855 RepID=A0A8C3D075_CAIMO
MRAYSMCRPLRCARSKGCSVFALPAQPLHPANAANIPKDTVGGSLLSQPPEAKLAPGPPPEAGPPGSEALWWSFRPGVWSQKEKEKKKKEKKKTTTTSRGSGPTAARTMLYRTYQSYCQRLQHDMYFLTSNSRLNEQVVDKIILQLNRVYPQILTDTEAEKFRNPKASLHTRLSYLIKHLQKKGDRHCQEFYRALQINAEQLYNDLPSRKILKTTDSTEIDTDMEKCMLNDRGPVFFLTCFSVAAGFALFWYCSHSGSAGLLGTHILEKGFLGKRRLQAALDSCQEEMSKLLPRNIQKNLRKCFSMKI